MLTGRQSGSGGDKRVNKTDRVEVGKEESRVRGHERRGGSADLGDRNKAKIEVGWRDERMKKKKRDERKEGEKTKKMRAGG